MLFVTYIRAGRPGISMDWSVDDHQLQDTTATFCGEP